MQGTEEGLLLVARWCTQNEVGASGAVGVVPRSSRFLSRRGPAHHSGL